ncbi:MAG: hypothetical protein JXB10_03740 [Pirellulales bacterium]|nr:hypothetical protein [Pirellulales bacterium]
MPSFWVKGPEIYAKVLYEEFRAAKERLRNRMRGCQTVVQRQALEEELEALARDYEKRLRGMDYSLF